MNIDAIRQMFGAGQQPRGLRHTKIAENYHVCGQLSVADVEAAKAEGFTTIICNRPDGESFGQPSADDIKTAAHAQGMSFHYLPVGHSGLSPEVMSGFKSAISSDSGKILAYCRSGNRSAILWQMAGGR